MQDGEIKSLQIPVSFVLKAAGFHIPFAISSTLSIYVDKIGIDLYL